MSKCIENFFNGNIDDAIKQAKRIRESKLFAELVGNYGYKIRAASDVASFLKGKITFAELCDRDNMRQKHFS